MLNYGYVGCVRDLFIDGRSKDIRQIAQSQNATGIKSSCSKVTGKQCDSNPCKNNGACKEGWNRFVCDCTGTGFWDSTCERGKCSFPFNLFSECLFSVIVVLSKEDICTPVLNIFGYCTAVSLSINTFVKVARCKMLNEAAITKLQYLFWHPKDG